MPTRQKKGESLEEFRARRAIYMRGWNAKRREKLIANPTKLCACGCGKPVLAQYHKKTKYARSCGSWNRGKEYGPSKASLRPATMLDLYWAAGFLEGEGSFRAQSYKKKSGNGRGWVERRIDACQVQREPLERLHAVFGGRIMLRTDAQVSVLADGREIHNRQPRYVWYVNSARAGGIMLTLYSFMSPKRREQIRTALSAWKRK